ncbi:MAG: glucose 1-dehydrogenase [Lachnospiraceae bacterium]|jgi:NAD(P)-dependent dehydrogenase (short-subunit alcohol dehydrogenase family)|nr:glucose 1-dehydrogenase [Lachnospiraceae bacterium]
MENEKLVPTYDLSGKVAIVTGATRGIGYRIASAFAAAGATVVITSRKPADCEAVQKDFEGRGYACLGVPIDVSDFGALDGFVTDVAKKFGHVDILVNNAGIGGDEAPILDITPEMWDKTHNIDLKGLYFLSKAFAAQVKEQGTGGRIINMASAAGIIAPRYVSVYGAAKAAVIHLTKIMANEWARYNINVNSVAPGYIKTDMTKEVMADEKNASVVLKKISLRRFGEPDDVSGVVLFLATEASKYVTGVLIPVDGGMTIN